MRNNYYAERVRINVCVCVYELKRETVLNSHFENFVCLLHTLNVYKFNINE